MKYIKRAIDYVFPYRCHLCWEFLSGENGFCHLCAGKFNFISGDLCVTCGFEFSGPAGGGQKCGRCYAKPPKFDRARSLLRFDEYSKKALHAFKYYDKTEMAETFARSVKARYGKIFAETDFIVPVPMHRLKRLLRNYNQAQVLAKALAKVFEKNTLPDLLIKSKWTKPQSSLKAKERRRNLSGSIKINPKYSIENKKILIADDVMTTGGTISECSSILKKAGASSVYVITIART